MGQTVQVEKRLQPSVCWLRQGGGVKVDQH